MHRFFVDEKIVNNEIIPSKELFHQLKRVLKISNNEKIYIINNGIEYESIFDNDIIKINNAVRKLSENENKKIILVQSLTKNSKIPFILQKLTELGVDEFIFVETQRSIPKLSDYINKQDRMKKIMIEASEQSGRMDVPKITFLKSINNLEINEGIVLVAYENEKNKTIKDNINEINKYKNIYLFVGPEGGITNEEISLIKEKFTNNKIVTINNNILRTETAAMSFFSIVNYELK